MEAGTEAPVPRPPDISPLVGKGPKANLPELATPVAKGLTEGGKIPAVAEPPLPSGTSTEPLGAMMPKLLVPNDVPDVKLLDCPKSVAVFEGDFVGGVPVPGCGRVLWPGKAYGAPFV